jgi:parvulin-like peptidyl-prolyl isomerase
MIRSKQIVLSICLKTLLFVTHVTTAHAQPLTQIDVLARSTTQMVTANDYRAYHYSLTDSAHQAQLKDPGQVKTVLDEILTVKEFKANGALAKDLTEQEKRYLDLSADRARYIAVQTVFERRAKDLAQSDVIELDKHAKEIYLTTDASGLKRDLSADFQHILFDLRKRSFPETAERVKAAQAELAAGTSFDAVVVKYSDEDRSQETKGMYENVPARSMDGVLARTLFDELKPGEHSKPAASRLGLHIVKLHALNQPQKRPYEEVKSAMHARLVEDAGRAAKAKVVAEIRTDVTKFDEDAISKFAPVPDAKALDAARKLSLESAKRSKALNAADAPVSASPPSKP